MQARLLFALALLARATGFGPAVPQRTLEGANFLGYNVVNLQSGNFSGDAAYVASTAGLLHAGVLRYPGGNLADWWDWKTGWCVAQPKVGCCPQLKNPCTKMVERGIIRVYRLEEFMLALDASGANAVLMMNMLTLTLADQMAYLEHAKSIGALRHGTYIELGGEFYWGKYGGRWATGVEYATEANTWAAAIKAKFPEARVMAVAAHSVANQAPGDRGFTWNSLVYATLNTSVVDGVTVHPYLHLDNVSGGAAPLQPGVPPRQKGQGPTGWYNDSTVQQRVAEFYQSRAGIEALLGVPFFVRTTAQGNLATHTPLPAGLRMIITEFNVMCRAGPLHLSWLHGIFIAATVFNLMAVPQVDAVLLHVLLNGFGWGALYETDADFSAPFGGTPPPGSSATAVGAVGCLIKGCTGLKTRAYSPTAVGTALGALSASMQGSTAMQAEEIAFAHSPVLHGGANPSGLRGNVSYPSLLGFTFTSAAQPTNATILNLGSVALSYTFGTDCVMHTSWTTPDTRHQQPLAWVSTDAPVVVSSTSCVDGTRSVQLPPYSITTLRFN